MAQFSFSLLRGWDMRSKLVAAIALLTLAGCNQRKNETGAVGGGDTSRVGVDTAIQSSRIKDTTVVKKDTSVDVDTTKKTDHIKDKK
jgi:uncharacterized lipoprotein NlpE involved in copper resistance